MELIDNDCDKLKISEFSQSCYRFHDSYCRNRANDEDKLWNDWIVKEWTNIMINVNKNECQAIQQLYKLQNEENNIDDNLLESIIMNTMTNDIIETQNKKKYKLLKETDIGNFISTFLSIKSLSSIDNEEIISIWHNLLPNYVHPMAKDIITSIIQLINEKNKNQIEMDEKEMILNILFESAFNSSSKEFAHKM